MKEGTSTESCIFLVTLLIICDVQFPFCRSYRIFEKSTCTGSIIFSKATHKTAKGEGSILFLAFECVIFF